MAGCRRSRPEAISQRGQTPQRTGTGEHSAETIAGRRGTRQSDVEGTCRGKLLNPERRRRAVIVLQDRFRVSQRRACRLAGQNRSTQRHPAPLATIEQEKLRRRILQLARRHVRWGRRLVYHRLRIEGWSVNHKRVQRGSGGKRASSARSHAARSAHDRQTAPGSCYGLSTPIMFGQLTFSLIRRWMGEGSSF